ncbi:cyclic nucleotide-binding domain-containing protein [Paracoccus sp. PAR01]|uniref:cyclic nucleotide-binding domain-containing protein n=1 Tax=Paracoccus sp. PAR01 TaxID=2769282 RepID=UPI00177F01FA|nr:cyclic nucleotide-binding domain-containing protein [Paracoccus sp. PAR01]
MRNLSHFQYGHRICRIRGIDSPLKKHRLSQSAQFSEKSLVSVTRAEAEAIILQSGWLTLQPSTFQKVVLSRSLLQNWEAGGAIYRAGDPPGGIYGLVQGSLAISMASPNEAPRFVQFGISGAWAGEGPFLTGEPRRVEMRAITSCTLFHYRWMQCSRWQPPTRMRSAASPTSPCCISTC